MRKFLSILALFGPVTSADMAFAAERTLTFAVENMTCASCPFIVRESMAAVPGVLQVEVLFEAQRATVTFDDEKTNAEAIAEASTNAGFPARPIGNGS